MNPSIHIASGSFTGGSGQVGRQTAQCSMGRGCVLQSWRGMYMNPVGSLIERGAPVVPTEMQWRGRFGRCHHESYLLRFI